MDRYEFELKTKQLAKLVRSRDYINAAKIAEELDWKKIKQWSVLSDGIDAFIGTNRYSDARNVCIYAYNRNLGGKRLLSTLVDVYLELGEYEDAEEVYQEYARVANREMSRLTLLYRLRLAQKAPYGELIDILTEYKDNELDEEYEYELARIYGEAGFTDKCVAECDELVLWFAEGEYVKKALELKSKFVELTPLQKEKLEKLSAPENHVSYEETFEEEPEEENAVEEAPVEDVSEEEVSEDEAFSEFASQDTIKDIAVKQEDEIGADVHEEQKTEKYDRNRYADDLVNTTEWTPIDIENALNEPSAYAEAETAEKPPAPDADEPLLEEDYDIKITVPDYSVYDTFNVQKELKANMDVIMEAYHNREEKDRLSEEENNESAFDAMAFLNDDSVSEPTKEVIINSHPWRKASRNKKKSVDGSTIVLPEINEMNLLQEEEKQETIDDQIEGQMDITQWLSSLEEEENEPEEEPDSEIQVIPAVEFEVEEENEEELPQEELPKEELPQEELAQEELPQVEEPVEDISVLEVAVSDSIEKMLDADDLSEDGYVLKDEERECLKSYFYMAGIERKLSKYVSTYRNHPTAKNSHVVIMGNNSIDKKAFAIALYRALHILDDEKSQSLAVVGAEKVRQRGFETIASQLEGHSLIIEQAGRLDREQTERIIDYMEKDKSSAVFFFIDDEFSMNKLLNENRRLEDYVGGSFLLKPYSVNELVDFARDYAQEKDCRIDDRALTSLYLALDELNSTEAGDIVEDVHILIDRAIRHAKRRLSNKLFGRFISRTVIKTADILAQEDDDYVEDDEEYSDEEYSDEEYADEEYADEERAAEEYEDAEENTGEEYSDEEYTQWEYDDEYIDGYDDDEDR